MASEAEQTLAERHHEVTALTQMYYHSDVVPPTTRAHLLRAQKFSVLYYYFMNAAFFFYAMFIPARLQGPLYGGLDIRDAEWSLGHAVIMGVVLIIVMVRFLILSWADAFYQFAVVLLALEVACLIFVSVYWSSGMPVLLVLLLSNMLNIAVSQSYWKGFFIQILSFLETSVPPSPGHVTDTTSLQVFPGLRQGFLELMKLWGINKYRSEATLYDERCGVFTTKNHMAHVKAMALAYAQALNPFQRVVPWAHNAGDLSSAGLCGMMDGLLHTFISNAAYTMTGLWFGQVLFSSVFHAEIAIVLAILMVVTYFVSMRRTLSWLAEGLGVAVAEKEWLAHDVVKHQGEREKMLYDVLDLPASMSAGHEMATTYLGVDSVADSDLFKRGRLNLTFMWQCVATVADTIGESYLARLYWNLAAESRFMLEELTPYTFKLFAHSKWEVTIAGLIQKTWQTLLLTITTTLYFGTYYDAYPLPRPIMSVLFGACFVYSVLALTEALWFGKSILGAGETTHRNTYVSESILVVAVLVILVNVVLWLYLLPMMADWEFPIGKCKLKINRNLFPSACRDGF